MKGSRYRKTSAASAALVIVFAVLAPAAQAGGLPTVDDTWATGVTASGAELHALINPEGVRTTYHFAYITDAAYQANLAANPPREPFAGAKRIPAADAVVGSGEGDVAVVQHPVNLALGTIYHYRALATSTEGERAGPERTFTTRQSGATEATLLDGRGWEMVSPVEKNGGVVEPPGAIFGGGVFAAAAQGSAISYSAPFTLGEAAGAPPASQYIAARGSGSWANENISAPLAAGGYPDSDQGVPYQLFSPDLAAGLLSNGRRCREEGIEACPVPNPPIAGSGAPAGYRNYYLRNDTTGAYQALLTEADAPDLTATPPEGFEVTLLGASPDLRHVVLSSCTALTAEAVEAPGSEGCDATKQNLYEWSGGTLKAINLLPGQTQTTPGAALGAQSGAISADGSRVYFTEGGDLYLRKGSSTAQADASQGGGGVFQTASADGSVAFFSKAGHLYRFSAASEDSTDLTPAGEVQGVLGASAAGSRVYYQDASGLKLWDEGATTQVAAGAEAALSSDWPPPTGTARVSGDGAEVLFLSQAPLTGYDNHGATEVFLWSGGGLSCVSCNPTGSRPPGPSTIPGAIANGTIPGSTDSYKPRALSANGKRVFFDSADSLVAGDTDLRPDVYEWEAEGEGTCEAQGGCLGLISGGRVTESSSFIDASADGADAFFITGASLVGTDPGSVDLYDARVGGGFPEPEPVIPCEGDACQGPAPAPEDPTPGTATLVSSGNLPLVWPNQPHKRHHRHRKHHRKHRRGR